MCKPEASALTGSQSPRKAVNPANAVLNYLYAILQAEARIAALAVGLDPVLGLLHCDQRNRDSLAADLMEPVRPAVDAFLFDFLARHTFTRRDVYELFDGQCRLLPPLTEQLAQTAPLWARRAMPVAQQLAARLLAAEREQGSLKGQSDFGNGTHSKARPRRGQQVVLREYKARIEPQNDPRRSPAAGTKRRMTMVKVVAANREWDSSRVQHTDPDRYQRTIAPRLHRLRLTTLMAATGLSKGACSQIRRGKVVPHPRHWEALSLCSDSSGAGTPLWVGGEFV